MTMDPRFPRPRGPSLWAVGFALALLGVFLAGGLAAWLWWASRAGPVGVDPDARPRPVAEREPLLEIEKAFVRVYKDNSPSVVHVTTLVQQANFGGSAPAGTGSGFVWDEEGHVVTNFHVIQNANSARVTLSDKATYPAYYVGGAPDKDLAVLYIDAPRAKLRPVVLGRSSDLEVGQFAFAIGNPFGLEHTYTKGIVSALGREIDSVVADHRITDVIQTDAAINPGNSGGPLLDSAGRLIGVNTAIYSKSGSSAGIGFAIPVDEVNRVVPKLIREGKTQVPKIQKKTRPGLGVQVASDELARQHGVGTGVAIARVLPGTPAARAGLRGAQQARGRVVLDVVVAIDGKRIEKVEDLTATLSGYQIGDAVSVEVVRDGRRLPPVKVTLGPVD